MTQRNASPKEILGIAIIAIFVLVPVFIFRSYISHPFVKPHLLSPRYEWPEGCKPSGLIAEQSSETNIRYYRVMDKIPKSCMTEKYYFSDAEKYNFPQQKGVRNWGRNYYRVGEDAINFDCNRDDSCVAAFVIEGVFIQNEKSQ